MPSCTKIREPAAHICPLWWLPKGVYESEKEKKRLYAQDTRSDPLHSLFEVGIIEYDGWALTAKLKGDALQVRLRRSLHDLTPDNGTACEGHLANERMLGECLAGGGAKTLHDVEHAIGEAGLLDKLGEFERRERCYLRLLQYNGIACSERRGDLPHHDHNYR